MKSDGLAVSSRVGDVFMIFFEGLLRVLCGIICVPLCCLKYGEKPHPLENKFLYGGLCLTVFRF